MDVVCVLEGGIGLCEAKIEMSFCQMMKIFYHNGKRKSLQQMGEVWIKCFLRNVLYFLLVCAIRNGVYHEHRCITCFIPKGLEL